MQAAMPVKDMATSTATLGLLRQLGSTIGVSVGQAIWSSELRKRIALIPNANINTSSANLADSIRLLKNIEPASLRQQVQHAYTKSISTIWIVDTPFIGVCLVMVFFLKKYSFTRKVVRTDDAVGLEATGVNELPENAADASPARTIYDGTQEPDLEKGSTKSRRSTKEETLEQGRPGLSETYAG
ncbi:hypothetical protein PHLCEN_2v1690 [Hermanssonia centrifuga]|uniref:Uncharacterized protein n=1 Tax=Hermanssonia centrifuga TaxID=98765 RepID=A0A2R6RZA6_9APHY|nr:hypothetical protein PHLCEN_2v1690 [Hermanssonia centrifuga]